MTTGVHPELGRTERDTIGPALGLVLAGAGSLALWSVVGHVARWAAHVLF